MPYSFAETNTGLLLLANGINKMFRWDGFTPALEPAGLAAPTAAITVSGTIASPGAIVGTYYGYVRYVDRLGNVSNLSPISAAYVASNAPVAITGFTTGAPIIITAPAHGKVTGDRVLIAGCYLSQANGDWNIVRIDANNFTLTGSSALSRAQSRTGGSVYSGVGSITFSGLPVPSDPKVRRRQLLRNTNGETSVFYVDLDTTDLTSTSLTTTKTDATLSAQTAVALLDEDGRALANRHGVPPNYKAVVAAYLDRIYAAVDVEYTTGNVSVVNGSNNPFGIGTEWIKEFEGRYLSVLGTDKAYLITTVQVAEQGLIVDSPYAAATNAYATYMIRPAASEKRLVYYSEAGYPESWPATNALQIQNDGDEITGLMPRNSFLYILERRHIYRFTTLADPAKDGSLYLAANRGCVNNRCWVVVEDTAYMLDDKGAFTFGVGGAIEPISDPIQSLFRGDMDSRWRINWQSQKWFHACHDIQNQCVRWFVCLGGQYLPRHVICYGYQSQRWWIEEFPVPIGSSVVASIDGQPQLLYGSNAARVFAANKGTLDGLDGSTGTVRGTATATGWRSLTDSTANLPASNLIGRPICITHGRGKGQLRIIATRESATKVTITTPWDIIPDTTSTYQIGGVQWQFDTKWYHIAPSEVNNERRLEIVFQPAANPATMDVRKYFNLSEDAEVQEVNITSTEGESVEVTKGETDLVVDLTEDSGMVQMRFDGSKEAYVHGLEYIKIQLAGVQAKDRVKIHQMTVDGVSA